MLFVFREWQFNNCSFLISKMQPIQGNVGGEKSQKNNMVEIAGPLLLYLSELLAALKYSTINTPPSPSLTTASEGELLLHDVEAEWMDDTGGEDEDSGGEESVKTLLFSKPCPFTIQKTV